MNDVWELPVIQFLNDLVYLRAKSEFDREQAKKAAEKYKHAKHK